MLSKWRKRMKKILNGLKYFLEAVFLLAFLYVVLQLGINASSGSIVTGAPLSETASAPGYPAPENFNSSPNTETTYNPYPAPGEADRIATTVDCNNMGTWSEYANKQAGFSFQYPSESELFESVDNNGYPNVTLYLKPYCYDKEWWGPKQVDIVVLFNSDKLSIEDFVVKQYSFDTSTDSSTLSREVLSSSSVITIENISGLQVNGPITKETPRVYIPYNDLVIFVGLTNTSNMPPFEQASPAILDLYNKIVSSVKLLNN